jgi:hypothetical protein
MLRKQGKGSKYKKLQPELTKSNSLLWENRCYLKIKCVEGNKSNELRKLQKEASLFSSPTIFTVIQSKMLR